MATEVEKLFDKLESQRTILSTCTDIYKTLTSHFTTLEQAIESKTLTLDSKIQSLDSNYQQSLDSLRQREESIPDRLSSLSSLVESRKESAIAEFQNPNSLSSSSISDELKSLCRKMDHTGLFKFVVEKRKEALSLRTEMANALAESVDPPRLVLDTVKVFVDEKKAAKSGLTDKRWACQIVVGALFPSEEKEEEENSSRVGPMFSRAMVEKAEALVKEWIERAEKASGGGDGVSGMGPAEASMLLQIIVGFGLKDKFEEEFYKKMVIQFATRRDMAKLAASIFGDKVGDIIDELVKNGKEVEAVYFASESGLTEKFQPAALLKAHIDTYKKNTTDILKKGNHSSAATDEANNLEINSIKAIIKCVEDHKIEAEEFPLETLKKRLTVLEKAKADKKKSSSAGSKPSNKRGPGSFGSRASGPPPPRPAKITKYSSPYSQYGQRNPISPAHQSPLSRYPAPYNYPSQSSYDVGLTSGSGYGLSYGSGSHISASSQITPPHYGISGDSVASSGVARLGGSYGISSETVAGGAARLGGSYGGGHTGYSSYEYSTSAPSAYQPSSYTQ